MGSEEAENLPAYSYVPGLFAHPIRDPDGHSFGRKWPTEPPLSQQNWRQSELYSSGLRLFNHGYYWESHEVWEHCWNACGRSGVEADFLKGLIHLAAAGVKAKEQRVNGVSRHAAKAKALFDSVRSSQGTGSFLGLDLTLLCNLAAQLAKQAPIASTDAVRNPVPLLGELP